MFRRLTAVAVLSLSLLGLAAPALACSLFALRGDCCSPGSSSCPSGDAAAEQALQAMRPACCGLQGTAAPMLTADAARATGDRTNPGSPDSFVASAWAVLAPELAEPPLFECSSIQRPRDDARLTYLHTGRLRL